MQENNYKQLKMTLTLLIWLIYERVCLFCNIIRKPKKAQIDTEDNKYRYNRWNMVWGRVEMKTKVDPDLCTGCELCMQICPEVFEMEDDSI